MRGNLIKIRSCTTFKWFNWFDGLCIELFKFYEEKEEEEKEKQKNKKKKKKRKRKRNEALKLYFFISSLFLFVVYTSRH